MAPSTRAPRPTVADRPDGAAQAALWQRWELPTWGVAAAIYLGYGALTWWYSALPWWLVLPAGGWLVCWHGSLQHEALHGHPTRRPWLNAALAALPLSLWLPFAVYRDSHLAHHRTAALTRPGEDPESFYVTPGYWARCGPLRRGLLRAHNTLAGRLVLGPPLVWARFAASEWRRLAAGDRRRRRQWLAHLVLLAGLWLWLGGVCGITPWAYLLLFAWPGLSLTLLRSYAEHRPALDGSPNTALVEAAAPWALLYLNNNLHAAHHAHPGVPWYQLPALRRRADADVDGYPIAGYGALVRRFLLRPKDAPVYPG